MMLWIRRINFSVAWVGPDKCTLSLAHRKRHHKKCQLCTKKCKQGPALQNFQQLFHVLFCMVFFSDQNLVFTSGSLSTIRPLLWELLKESRLVVTPYPPGAEHNELLIGVVSYLGSARTCWNSSWLCCCFWRDCSELLELTALPLNSTQLSNSFPAALVITLDEEGPWRKLGCLEMFPTTPSVALLQLDSRPVAPVCIKFDDDKLAGIECKFRLVLELVEKNWARAPCTKTLSNCKFSIMKCNICIFWESVALSWADPLQIQVACISSRIIARSASGEGPPTCALLSFSWKKGGEHKMKKW